MSLAGYTNYSLYPYIYGASLQIFRNNPKEFGNKTIFDLFNEPEKKDFDVPLSNWMKDRGYITGYSSDYCSMPVIENILGTNKSEFDHMLNQFACDPNYFADKWD